VPRDGAHQLVGPVGVHPGAFILRHRAADRRAAPGTVAVRRAVAVRRRAGLRVPPRPAAAVMLAVAVAVSWLGLAFGTWAPLLAIAPLVAAIVLELYPREHP
jgi:hypothetical protein